MELEPFFEKVEDAILTMGVDPLTTRCEGEGQWLLNRGSVEVYIDVWQPAEHHQWEYFRDEEPAGIFQVVVPVCKLPEDQDVCKLFFEELLYMNFHMFYGSFTVNFDQRIAAIQFRRLLEGINRVEIIEPIEGLGYYAESLKPYLSEKYGAQEI